MMGMYCWCDQFMDSSIRGVQPFLFRAFTLAPSVTAFLTLSRLTPKEHAWKSLSSGAILVAVGSPLGGYLAFRSSLVVRLVGIPAGESAESCNGRPKDASAFRRLEEGGRNRRDGVPPEP